MTHVPFYEVFDQFQKLYDQMLTNQMVIMNAMRRTTTDWYQKEDLSAAINQTLPLLHSADGINEIWNGAPDSKGADHG